MKIIFLGLLSCLLDISNRKNTSVEVLVQSKDKKTYIIDDNSIYHHGIINSTQYRKNRLLQLPNQYYTQKGKKVNYPEGKLGLKYLIEQNQKKSWNDFCKKLNEYESMTVFLKRGSNIDINLIEKICDFKKIYVEDYDSLDDINHKLNQDNLGEYFDY